MASWFADSVAQTVSTVEAVTTTFRARDLARRAGYETRRRTGLLALAETRHRAVSPIDTRWRIDVPHHDRPAGDGVDAAEQVLAGSVDLYGGRPRDTGWPPEWSVNPDSGARMADQVHWTALDDSGRNGDIKDVWELSRFGFVGPLVRAWACTGDERYPEAFWTAVESWTAANPPFLGPNWMCGQETSLRAISMLFGLGVFSPHPTTTPARRQLVDELVCDSVQRVRPTIGYALSQRNNHAISEASFLFAAACLLPDHQHRDRLLRQARRALSGALRDQFYPDGSYAQYSPTYQRLAVHTLLFVDLVGRATGIEPPREVDAALSSSYRFLTSLLDLERGWLPNLGGNDGALLFELTSGPRRDFRPLLTTLAARAGRSRPFPPGPWDEEARWFGYTPGPSNDTIDDAPADSGFTVLRGSRSQAMLRAGSRRHRPAHADMLHVDLWIGGVNVALDPGTYRYSAPAPWGNALAEEAVHNVPRPPGRPQAVRRGRFFWTSWHDAEVVDRSTHEVGEVIVARLQLRDVTLHRLLGRNDNLWVVLDRASSGPITTRWNLPDGTVLDGLGVSGETFSGRFEGGAVGEGTADPHDPESGWQSPTYGELEACTALTVHGVDGWTAAWFTPRDVALPGPDQAGTWWDILAEVEQR